MPAPRKPSPTTSPVREKNQSPYRDSPSRRQRDIETGGHPSRNRSQANSPSRPTRRDSRPGTPGSWVDDREPTMATQVAGSDLGRKKSLIRPERNRIDRDHPNYHYRKHARDMEVLPSTTGNDPITEDDDDHPNSPHQNPSHEEQYTDQPRARMPGRVEPVGMKRQPRKLTRKLTRKNTRVITEEEKRQQRELDMIRPPSLWNVYCAIITFWCPDAILNCFGMPAKAQRRAWREKMGLISIIILVGAF